jgi:hypothetical protein
MKNGLVAGIFSVFLLSAMTSGCGLLPDKLAVLFEEAHPMDEDELLVLDPPADYLRHLPDMGLEVVDVTNLDGIGSKLYHLRIIDGKHPHHARDGHERRFPDVIVDAHHHYGRHAVKIDKSYNARNAAKWKAKKASCGAGIRIGVIDGVVDVKHDAFKGSKISYRSFHLKGEKLANSGHGTAVTAVIAGRGAWGGLLPGAEIVAANVFHRGKGGKAIGSAKSIVQAIDWMIQKKVPVVNMSIGGNANKLVAKAVEHASAIGMIMVASSGNSGPFSRKKFYPSAYPPVIAITAVDRFDRNASFATSGDYIEFAAPGVGIWTAVPGGGKAMSGTSFSAPIVSAYAAAAQKHLGIKTMDDLRAYFQKHARDRGNPGRDKYTGWGILQLPPIC